MSESIEEIKFESTNSSETIKEITEVENPNPGLRIADCKDDDITLRTQQTEWAEWTENDYEEYEVDVGVLPVAAGKSRCLTMLSNWLTQTFRGIVAALTPTKMLQDQYEGDFEWIPTLKGANAYPCVCNKGVDCARTKLVTKNYCKSDDGGCTYLNAVQTAKGSDVAIFNFHSYYFGKNWRKNIIIDEAHNAVNFVMGMFGTELWKFRVNYPVFKEMGRFGNTSIKLDHTEVAEWLDGYIKELDAEMNAVLSRTPTDDRLASQLESRIRNLSFVRQGLLQRPEDILVLKKKELYFGQDSEYRDLKGTEQEYIYIKPLKIDKLAEKILWPRDVVKKIVLLSATIGEQDIKALGLQDRKVRYFECGSPIAPERRPFVYWPVVDMSWKQRDKSLPALIKAILKISEKYPDKKGLIHCTYAVADKLRKTGAFGDRFMFHGKRDKSEAYYKYRESKEPKILVASGMSEGIDLAGEKYGFQIITMVQKPNISDDVNFWRLKYDRDAYNWEVVRTVTQQTGRICRGPKDKGDTWMLDKQYGKLFYDTHTLREQNGKKSMWYKWFLEAVKW